MIIFCINIFIWGVYKTLGSLTTSQILEMRVRYIFYILRPEYMIVSGVVSAIAIILAIILIIIALINGTAGKFINTFSVIGNSIYIYLYIKFLSIQ